jgi:hypothetical protein
MTSHGTGQMTALVTVEPPPHSSGSSSSNSSSKSETSLHESSSLHLASSNGSDSGHHESNSSNPSTPRTGSHYTDHDSGILGGELCELGEQDSFSSGSDSGFCLHHDNNSSNKKLSYCSRCSQHNNEDMVVASEDKETEKKSPPASRGRRGKAGLLQRRHSRASSVDRREIFNKYIQRSGEHSDSVRPFSSDDPELCHGEKDRNQDELILENHSTSSMKLKDNVEDSLEGGGRKEFRLVRLVNNGLESHLGIFIAKKSQTDIGCHGFYVAHIMPDGLVMR